MVLIALIREQRRKLPTLVSAFADGEEGGVCRQSPV